VHLLDHFVKRFPSEVSDLDHILFGAVDKIPHGVNAGALQAVEAADRQVKFLNGHPKDVVAAAGLRGRDDRRAGSCVGEVHKEAEMFVENLGGE